MSAEVKALIERFDHLRNSGICSPTTRGLLDDAEALLAALSSPPADDVREALIEGVKLDARNLMRSDPRVWYEALESALDKTLPGFWAAATQVRPYGTVTDTEGAWEYGVRHVDVDGWPTDLVHESLEGARADLATCGWNCFIIRRRAAQEAGKWEPLEAAREARS